MCHYLREVFESANKIGVARTTLANYEQGTRFPDKETLLMIADFFDVSLDYLVGRSPADKIKKAISDDPELQETWEQISQKENPAVMLSYF